MIDRLHQGCRFPVRNNLEEKHVIGNKHVLFQRTVGAVLLHKYCDF